MPDELIYSYANEPNCYPGNRVSFGTNPRYGSFPDLWTIGHHGAEIKFDAQALGYLHNLLNRHFKKRRND